MSTLTSLAGQFEKDAQLTNKRDLIAAYKTNFGKYQELKVGDYNDIDESKPPDAVRMRIALNQALKTIETVGSSSVLNHTLAATGLGSLGMAYAVPVTAPVALPTSAVAFGALGIKKMSECCSRPVRQPSEAADGENKSKYSWKKIAGITTGLALAGVAAYAGYRHLTATPPIMKPVHPAEEGFIKEFELAQQCPSIETYVEHQKDNGYFGWGLESMSRLFGSERDLSPSESRNKLYHEEIQQKFPEMVKNHWSYEGNVTKEIAQDISELRGTAREYTRQRGPKVAHQFLNTFEPRERSFNFYWNKYQDPQKLVDGAMRSHPKYDSKKYLAAADSCLVSGSVAGCMDLAKKTILS